MCSFPVGVTQSAQDTGSPTWYRENLDSFLALGRVGAILLCGGWPGPVVRTLHPLLFSDFHPVTLAGSLDQGHSAQCCWCRGEQITVWGYLIQERPFGKILVLDHDNRVLRASYGFVVPLAIALFHVF